LHRQGEIPAAIAGYRDCIVRRPEYPDAAGNLGLIRQAEADLSGEILLYRETLARNPDHRETAFNLASCLQRSGDSEGAVRCRSQPAGVARSSRLGHDGRASNAMPARNNTVRNEPTSAFR
jgi:tetratricopeptide (TPR) repeat protein